jgi:hypothetical protein
VRFVTRRFITEYSSNSNQCYEHDVTYADGQHHRFQIIDVTNSLKDDHDTKHDKELDHHIKWAGIDF